LLLLFVLSALFVSGAHRPTEQANRVKCVSNLRQIGESLLAYAAEHGHQFPDSLPALAGVMGHEVYPADLVCPSSNDSCAGGSTPQQFAQDLTSLGLPEDYLLKPSHPELHLSYAYFGRGLTTDAPPDAILAIEPPSNHGGDGMTVLYANGTVTFIPKPRAEKVIRELLAGHNPPRDQK
jgi:hypothetical protein